MSGGVTIDHSASERVPTTSPVLRRAQSRAASVSSRSTQPAEPPHASVWNMRPRRSLAAIQKQDAEIRRELVKKRLAMNLAEIEAATECDEAEEHAVHRTEDSCSSWKPGSRAHHRSERGGPAELADAINNWRDRGRYRAKFMSCPPSRER
ncbi:hypothetical protein EVAR_60081_1 [Eumeta japonica]|uniref:Uncharacterized protein n=1 Tax=Eumeta variegata TaxID=151549 RepID=A0A4C1YI53_EUMVA|nr:hypothetical protein EVAR_60081_1 [Eumeta japonica]